VGKVPKPKETEALNMNQRRLALNLIIDHFTQQKWFQDDLAAYNAAKDLRSRRAIEVCRRAEHLPIMGPGAKQQELKRIREEVEKEVV